MPLARVRTQLPSIPAELERGLRGSGFEIEIARPDEPREGHADLEIALEAQPSRDVIGLCSQFEGNVYVVRDAIKATSAPQIAASLPAPHTTIKEQVPSAAESIREPRFAAPKADPTATERAREEQLQRERQERQRIERLRVEALLEQRAAAERLRMEAEQEARRKAEQQRLREQEEQHERERHVRLQREAEVREQQRQAELRRQEHEREQLRLAALSREQERDARIRAEEQRRFEKERARLRAEGEERAELRRREAASAEQQRLRLLETERHRVENEVGRQISRDTGTPKVVPISAASSRESEMVGTSGSSALQPQHRMRPVVETKAQLKRLSESVLEGGARRMRRKEYRHAAVTSAVLTIIIMSLWIALSSRHPADPLTTRDLVKSNSIQQQKPFGASKIAAPVAIPARPAVQPTSTTTAAPAPEAKAAVSKPSIKPSPLRRTKASRRGGSSVESDDEVVVRHFGTKTASTKKTRASKDAVKVFSDLE